MNNRKSLDYICRDANRYLTPFPEDHYVDASLEDSLHGRVLANLKLLVDNRQGHIESVQWPLIEETRIETRGLC